MGLDAYFLAKFKDDETVDGEKYPYFPADENSSLYGYREIAYYRKSWNLQDWLSRNVSTIDYDNYFISVPIDKLKDLYFEVWRIVTDANSGINVSNEELVQDPYATVFDYENDLWRILNMSDEIEDVIYYGSW